MRVSVYFNLHKRLFSVRAESGPSKGRVIAHTDAVFILGARYVVNKAGRERVLREKRKNVHAFVRGNLICTGDGVPSVERGKPVGYNPYRADHFELNPGTDLGEPIHGSYGAVLRLVDGKPRMWALLS